MYRVWFENRVNPAYAALLDGVAVIHASAALTPDDPFGGLPGADAMVVGGGLRYDGAVMDKVPTVRIISRTGIGIDNIDVEAATARGIPVCNAPDAPTISTAEHTIALLLAVARDLKRLDRILQRGAAKDSFASYRGIELQGLQLGVVGLGRIGSRVSQMARGLGMSVVGYDPWIAPERAATLEIEVIPSLEILLQTSDAVTLHAPLTPETHHLINARTLAMMKPGALLINAARGGLVDESALLAALESGHLAGAGLDVFAKEPPPPDHPLILRDDVIATPHIASSTGVGRDRIWHTAIKQALQALQGERPPHLINPSVWTDTR